MISKTQQAAAHSRYYSTDKLTREKINTNADIPKSMTTIKIESYVLPILRPLLYCAVAEIQEVIGRTSSTTFTDRASSARLHLTL